MLKWVEVLLDLLDKVAQYFANQQLINAGKAEQQGKTQQEVDTNVTEAKRAVDVPDSARTERLRSRFDDASGE